MGPSYPLGISRVGPASLINPLLTKREVKMAVSWPHFLFFFWLFLLTESNIQPSKKLLDKGTWEYRMLPLTRVKVVNAFFYAFIYGTIFSNVLLHFES